MLGNVLSSVMSWITGLTGLTRLFSKTPAFFIGIIICIGLCFVWRNAVERLEVRTVLFEERLSREQGLVASWKGEALRLQGLVKSSSNTVKRCLERERSTSQAQAMVRTLVQDLRQKAGETKNVPTDILGAKMFKGPCSGHERVLEYLERPLMRP